MKKTPIPVVSSLFSPRSRDTVNDAEKAYRSVMKARLPSKLIVAIRGPAAILNVESKILLPIISHNAIAYSFFLAAVMSTTSSGREVTMARTKKLVVFEDVQFAGKQYYSVYRHVGHYCYTSKMHEKQE